MEDTTRILELAEKAQLKGKVGAAFGAYGWSGEAPAMVSETMTEGLGMDVLAEPFWSKPPPPMRNAPGLRATASSSPRNWEPRIICK